MSSSTTYEPRERLAKDIADAEKELDRLGHQVSDLEYQLDRVHAQLSSTTAQIARWQQEIYHLNLLSTEVVP
jgi:peptidoglycan hydrolase CwlO-like protein